MGRSRVLWQLRNVTEALDPISPSPLGPSFRHLFICLRGISTSPSSTSYSNKSVLFKTNQIMLLLCFKILQWIPIAFIIKSKILTITHKALLEYDLCLSFQISLVSLSCMLIIH